MGSSSRVDAVVIGAGVNGLTAGTLLARAGLETLVLEKLDRVGGTAGSYAFAPGFRASVGFDDVGLLRPQIVRELELPRHGLELLEPDPLVFAPAPGGGLTLWRDLDQTVREIRKHSATDAEAYPRFVALVQKLKGFLRPLLTKPVPTPEPRGGGDLLELLRLGLGFRALGSRTMHELLRVAPLSIQDFLDEWFESPLLKAVLGAPGVEHVCLGPRSAGTALLFLYQQLAEDDAPLLSRKVARGGAGAVSEALKRALAAASGKLELETPVRRIVATNGVATGVELDGGVVEASVVLSTLAPEVTFRELGDASSLPPSFVQEIERIRYRGAAAKLNVALSKLPDFGAGGVEPQPHHRARIQLAFELDALERAYDDSKYGRVSESPLILATIPTVLDPSLAPEGAHVLSALVQYAPHELRGTTWTKERDRLSANVLGALFRAAPNLESAVLHHDLWTPDDYARRLALSGGSLTQGEMALDQMLFMRPVPEWAHHRTPLGGLYLGGTSCHPGGFLTGAPGWNAANQVLADR